MVRLTQSLLVVALIATLSSYGCASRSGFYHRVERGETVYRIAKAYKVSVNDVVRVNNMADKKRIRTGQYLFIPGKGSPKKITPSPQAKRAQQRMSSRAFASLKRRFVLPVRGEVNRYFGKVDRKKHTGVDFVAKVGDPVRAVSDGKVVFAGGSVEGFGPTVVIRHSKDIFSVYCHLGEIKVKKGDNIKREQVVAKVGKPNPAHLGQKHAFVHFELRDRTKAVDPAKFLPL